MLQLVDTVAYNVLRQFVDYGDSCDKTGSESLPMYDYFGRILNCIYSDQSGRVAGFGIVKAPEIKKLHWSAGE